MLIVYSPSPAFWMGMPERLETIVCNTAGSFTWVSSDATGYRSGVIPENEITQSPLKASITCLTIGLAISIP